MNKITYRQWQGAVFIISLIVLYLSLYFQYVRDLQPCPLCIMQRACVILLVILSIIGIMAGQRKATRILTILQLFAGIAGLFFAARQLWLQSLPADQVPACLPGLDVLFKYFPLSDVLHALFWGAGDCAEVDWQWLGVSMPGWAALYFVAMIGAAFVTQLKYTRLQAP
ncbi:disulfide bond formation protein B [Legionella dresdenensis]|uniref:Disulfide bond formation protein B n=1 Tax=Legionella dresdenensis TaxID=450200 RepID=A0ABV8CD29_9GAMM